MIFIKNISTYIPNSYLNLNNRFKNAKRDFLERKIGATKVSRMKKNENVVQMCIKSYKNLNMQINKKKIKIVILCTQNPDHNGLPHNSAIIQKKLNLENNIACLDISQGCAGYLYGLKVAESFLKHDELALFFTCDPYSKIIKPKDYNTELLFGDAATLSILSKSQTSKSKKLISTDFYTDGSHYNSIINNANILSMNGKNVMNFTKNKVPNFIKNFLNKNRLKIDEIDKFYFHQGSKHIVNLISLSLGLKNKQTAKFVNNIGNTVSSSVPILLSNENFQKDKKIIICGFGVGLSISIGLLV